MPVRNGTTEIGKSCTNTIQSLCVHNRASCVIDISFTIFWHDVGFILLPSSHYQLAITRMKIEISNIIYRFTVNFAPSFRLESVRHRPFDHGVHRAFQSVWLLTW